MGYATEAFYDNYSLLSYWLYNKKNKKLYTISSFTNKFLQKNYTKLNVDGYSVLELFDYYFIEDVESIMCNSLSSNGDYTNRLNFFKSCGINIINDECVMNEVPEPIKSIVTFDLFKKIKLLKLLKL